MKPSTFTPPLITYFTVGLSSGGTGKVLLNLTAELVQRGYRVDVILKHAEGPFLKALDPKVRLVELGTTHPFTSLPSLMRYLRRNQPHTLISDRPRLNKAAQRASRWAFVKPRILTGVHSPISQKMERLKASQKRRAQTTITRYFHRADGIVAVSRGVATELAEQFQVPLEKIHVIYNPVITAALLAQAAQPADHPWFRGPRSKPVILGAGRLTPQKDFDTLLRAFAIMHRKRPCRLMIIGRGKEQQNLQTLARELGIGEDLALPGHQANPYAIMAAANLFVLSSRWEGFGLVLAEAMAVGTPVVATDCEFGPAEILDHGRLGALVPVGDHQALADAMNHALNHPPDHRILQKAGRQFTSQACAEGYLTLMGLPLRYHKMT